MLLNKRTILITGGSSGIGFELATQLVKKGNTVIITGRSQTRLDEAKEIEPRLITVNSDVSNYEDVSSLYSYMQQNHPSLSVLINNAGIMRKIELRTAAHQEDVQGLCSEITVNLIALIQMTVLFLPLLEQQKEAAIVNISSGLAFVPFPMTPIYGASKAGVNSFTRALRVQLKNSIVKVFEIAPPATKTALTDDFKGSIDESQSLLPETVARKGIKGIEADRYQILPGLAWILKFMSRLAPEFMMGVLSKPYEKMLAEEEEKDKSVDK
jgi:uncharacterized oxidoreductase